MLVASVPSVEEADAAVLTVRSSIEQALVSRVVGQVADREHHDTGEDAEDRDDDQQFDEGEAPLATSLHPLIENLHCGNAFP